MKRIEDKGFLHLALLGVIGGIGVLVFVHNFNTNTEEEVVVNDAPNEEQKVVYKEVKETEAEEGQTLTQTTIIERIIQTPGITLDYLNTKLSNLKEELALSSNTSQSISYSSSGSSNSSNSSDSVSRSLLTAQTDSIYDSFHEADDDNYTSLISIINTATSTLASNSFNQGGNAFGATATLGTTDANSLSLITDNTARLTVTSDGNVGVGTESPSAPLDVSGSGIVAKFTGSAIDSGIHLINTATGGRTYSIGSTGTGSALPGLNIFDVTGVRPIMEVSPNGSVSFTDKYQNSHSEGLAVFNSSSNRYQFRTGFNNSFYWRFGRDNITTGDFQIADQTGNILRLTAGGIATITQNNGSTLGTLHVGTIGVGTTVPGGKLSVAGGGSFGDGYKTAAPPTGGLIIEGYVGIGTSAPLNNFVISDVGAGGLEINPSLTIDSATGVRFLSYNRSTSAYQDFIFAQDGGYTVIKSDGSLGINTTDPDYKLEVNNGVLGGIGGTPVANFRATDGGTAFLQAANTEGSWKFGIDGNENFVVNDTTNSILAIESGASANSLYVDSMGNVGVGTAEPLYKLSVTGTSNTIGIQASSNTANDTLFYGTGTVTGNLNLFKSTISATGSVAGVVLNSNTTAGNAVLSANVGGASAGDPYLDLTVSAVQNWTIGVDNSDSDKLKIGPNASPSNGTASLTITTIGNVGIGTITPISKLDIEVPLGASNTTNYGVRSVVTGGANSINIAGYFAASTASTNYSLYTGAGSIYLGGNIVSVGTINSVAAHSSTGGNIFIGDSTSSFSSGNGGNIVFAGDTVGQGGANSTFGNIRGIKENSSYNNSLGALVFGTQSNSGSSQGLSTVTEKMRITSTGNLGIATTTPTQKLVVNGNAQFTSVSSGAFSTELNLTAEGILTTSSSDRRLKSNEEILDNKQTLNKILQLQPKTFIWKSNNTTDFGLIAQEVQEIFPELVFTNKTDGYKGINYSRLPTLLIASIQELASQLTHFAQEFTTKLLRADRVETKELCVGSRCISEEAFIKLLESENVEGKHYESEVGTDIGTEVDTEIGAESDVEAEVAPEIDPEVEAGLDTEVDAEIEVVGEIDASGEETVEETDVASEVEVESEVDP